MSSVINRGHGRPEVIEEEKVYKEQEWNMKTFINRLLKSGFRVEFLLPFVVSTEDEATKSDYPGSRMKVDLRQIHRSLRGFTCSCQPDLTFSPPAFHQFLHSGQTFRKC